MIALWCYIFCAVILEMLPISSSTHMQVIAQALRAYDNRFNDIVFVQALDEWTFGVVVIVLALFFFPRWLLFFKTFPRSLPILFTLLQVGFIVELITLFFYIQFFYNGFHWFPVSGGLAFTTLALYSLRWIPVNNPMSWNYRNSLLLGIAQGIAFLPGISRLASTYVCARWVGIPAYKAFELSFLIEVPIALAAWAKGSYWLYIHHALYCCSYSFVLCILLTVSTAYLFLFLIKKLIYYNSFWLFSLYTGLLAIILYF